MVLYVFKIILHAVVLQLPIVEDIKIYNLTSDCIYKFE